MRPFRFGVNVRDFGSLANWLALARKVEGLGFSTLNVPDHLTERPAPMPALASAAAATTRLTDRDARAQQRLPSPRPAGA